MEMVISSQCVQSARRRSKIHKTVGDGETQCGKPIVEGWHTESPFYRNQICKACFGNGDIFIVYGHEVLDF